MPVDRLLAHPRIATDPQIAERDQLGHGGALRKVRRLARSAGFAAGCRRVSSSVIGCLPGGQAWQGRAGSLPILCRGSK